MVALLHSEGDSVYFHVPRFESKATSSLYRQHQTQARRKRPRKQAYLFAWKCHSVSRLAGENASAMDVGTKLVDISLSMKESRSKHINPISGRLCRLPVSKIALWFLGRARRRRDGLLESCTCRPCRHHVGPLPKGNPWPAPRGVKPEGVSQEGGPASRDMCSRGTLGLYADEEYLFDILETGNWQKLQNLLFEWGFTVIPHFAPLNS